jgi:hypothetical protein
MGMRFAEGAAGPRPLLVAAAALAAEAAGLCATVILNIIDSASGQSWTTSNAAGFIAVEVIAVIGLAVIASGIARVRPWSRTPAVLAQVFTIIVAISLLDGHRYGWGVPALLLAAVGLAGLFAPASLRALNRLP